jgi:tetratricopeptide (TPR) repeat protein
MGSFMAPGMMVKLAIAMKRNPTPCFITIFSALAVVVTCAASAQELSPLLERKWFEARTTHFQTFSCGETQAVARLAGRLEQFRISYSLLAGTQAVASPPIVVMAFPDHESLEPFLPVYQGKPANLAAFFSRGSDENLIALSLSDSGTSALQPVFHEYAHLLLRHNEQFWPMWLQEGMADIYGAFEVAGEHTVRIGGRQPAYVALLSQTPLMPLPQLFAVTQDSPGYNERDRQGIFYAESWLLTQYLMLGDNPAYRARFGQLTVLLRQGQSAEEAFTNAFRVTLSVFERQLQQYFERGRFDALSLSVPTSLYSPQAMALRAVGPVEACYRLGDQLLRLGRFEPAKAYFTQARKLAPASPLPYEGLGLLASEQHEHAEAVQFLGEAVRRGSVSFLAHYVYAREKFRRTEKAPATYTRLNEADAADIRKEVEKSLALMPNFGPAHHLLGFLEFLQGEDFATAAQHLRRAIELEPENPAYPLTLAQAQIFGKDLAAARRTLEPLRRPYVNAAVRSQAEELLQATQP